MNIEVTIEGTDITDYLAEVGTITRATDFPYPLETQPGTCRLELNDPTGHFSPTNDANFFTGKSLPKNGKKAAVIVRADSKTLFLGEIDEINQNTPDGITIIGCMDKSDPIRQERIENFGISKSFKMIQDTTEGDTHGIYPLIEGVYPVADGSFSGDRAANTPFNVVDAVKDVGVLDSENVAVADDHIISEGGPVPVTAGSAYPQATLKSPYRYRYLSELIKKILSHYGITSRNIQILPVEMDVHFSNYGRPGYDTVVGNVGSSNELSWFGYVTDYIVDGNDFYFAYTINRGQAHVSRILKYNRVTDTSETVYALPTAGVEVWGLAKIGNHLIMLLTASANVAGTSRPITGSYDSNTSSKVFLSYIDVTAETKTLTAIVDTSDARPPQLAHFYQIGSKISHGIPIWEDVALPDTRRRLLVHNNTLYYGFAKNNVAGVAKVAIGGITSEVMMFNSDTKNHAGFAYSILGDNLYFATTFLTPVNSTLKVVRAESL